MLKMISIEEKYVPRYQHAFEEEPNKKDLGSVLKSNEYLRECLRDLNYFINKKVEKQKDQIFQKIYQEEKKVKKNASMIVDEELQVLERELQNNNFIFSQQEKELKNLDERIANISTNQQFELVSQIELLNEQIRNERNEIKNSKKFNFHEGKYIENQILLPKVVESQQQAQFEMMKMQNVNTKIKEMTQKKEDQMSEYAKKISIVDKDYQEALQIEGGFQLPVDENLLKFIEKNKKIAENLELSIKTLNNNIEREQLRYQAIQRDLSLLAQHTDEKIYGIELSITKLNADIQQLRQLASGISPLPQKLLEDIPLTPNYHFEESRPQLEKKRTSQQELNGSFRRKLVIAKGNKIQSTPKNELKEKPQSHSIGIQQTPTNKEQSSKPQLFSSRKKEKEEIHKEEKKQEPQQSNLSKEEFLKKIDTLGEDEEEKKNPEVPHNLQSNKSQQKKGPHQQIFDTQIETNSDKEKKSDKDKDEENLDDIEAEILRLEKEEEAEKIKKQKANELEQQKLQQKSQGIKLSSDTQTGGSNQIQKVVIPNKNRESINNLNNENENISGSERLKKQRPDSLQIEQRESLKNLQLNSNVESKQAEQANHSKNEEHNNNNKMNSSNLHKLPESIQQQDQHQGSHIEPLDQGDDNENKMSRIQKKGKSKKSIIQNDLQQSKDDIKVQVENQKPKKEEQKKDVWEELSDQ